jgi:hypothetical protein
MAATKTRSKAKPKAAAKPKPKATAKPGVKGRTSKALKNRFDWVGNPDLLAALVADVDKAGRGAKQSVFEKYAKKAGNGVQWKSVRAQYYNHADAIRSGQPLDGRTTAAKAPAAKASTPTPTPSTPVELPTDPIARVRAMVNRKGELTRIMKSAERELADLDRKLAAIAG